MLDPRGDDRLGNVVFAKRLDEDLPSSRKLTAEDAMRTMRLVERPSFVFDGSAQVLCGVLVFESLDSVRLSALEQEADHQVIEAAIDEIVDDGAKLRLAS